MSEINIRMATLEDIPVVVDLIDMSVFGVAAIEWQGRAGPGESWKDIAKREVALEHVSFSYKNTMVAEINGNVVGMLSFTKQPDEMPAVDLDGSLPRARGFVYLRQFMAGGFYIVSIAVLPQYRRHRNFPIAMNLMDMAAFRCWDMGSNALFGIIHESNKSSLNMSYNRGYKVVAEYEVLDHPKFTPDSKWLLVSVGPYGGFLPDSSSGKRLQNLLEQNRNKRTVV